VKTSHATDRLGRVLPDPSWPVGRVAPPDLEPVRRFLNTINRENGADRLESPGPARSWLAAEGHRVQTRLSTVDAERLRHFRDLLHTAIGPDGVDRKRAYAALDRLADESVVRIRLSGSPKLEPLVGGATGVIASLLASVYQAAVDGRLTRMKACGHCAWVYFDHSKNASGTWCSSSACGARQKAAAYRRRRRDEVAHG
jgi:predicted RNA-binding Zn ribbon-like protein